MTTHTDHSNAYAQGRRDAADAGKSSATVGQILAAITTGMTAQLTALKNVRYSPPPDADAKVAYDRGWRDELG